MMDPTQAAPMGAPGAPGAAPGADQAGPVVCIASQPDGSFMVYPEGQDDAGQPAKDVDGALAIAGQLLQGGDGNASSSTEDETAALMSGFNQARGTPLNRS
jgi:hypothetical protein